MKSYGGVVMVKTIKNLKLALEPKILNANNTFIVAHKCIDLDGLGSAIGLSLIPKSLKRHSYIIVNEEDLINDTLVRKIMDEKCSNFRFIDKKKCLSLLSGNDLLLMTDVNNPARTMFDGQLDKFSDIFVIDHHDLYPSEISEDDIYINTSASSASEIVSNLLRISQIKYDADVATVLLAGINLDTNNYTKNRNSSTLRSIANLMDNGGDDAYITSLFIGDFSENIRRYEVASRQNTEFRTFKRETIVPVEDDENEDRDKSFYTTFSVAIATDPKIRGKVVLAQAADYLLDFADVSIALANISDKTISVHGRSKGQINIGELFTTIGGGGSARASAAEIEDCNLEEAKMKILQMFPPLSTAKKFI